MDIQENGLMKSQKIAEAARQMAYFPHSLQKRVLGYIMALMPRREHGVHGKKMLKHAELFQKRICRQ